MSKLKQKEKLILLSILAILVVFCYSITMYQGIQTSYAADDNPTAAQASSEEDENLIDVSDCVSDAPAVDIKEKIPVVYETVSAEDAKAKIDEQIAKTIGTAPDREVVPNAPIVSAEEKAREVAEREAEEARIEKEKNRIPNYSRSQIASLDLTKPSNITVADLKAIGNYTGLKGLEKAFVGAEEKYGVNCLFVYAIAVIESGGGAQCYRPNNMFGFMGKSFDSKSDAIYYVTQALSNNYLASNGSFFYGKTAAAVNTKYCTGGSWHGKIENVMYKMYQAARANNLAKYE